MKQNYHHYSYQWKRICLSLFFCLAGLCLSASEDPTHPLEQIKTYVECQEEAITAEDIATHFNMLSGTTYGATNEFNAGSTAFPFIIALNSTHFVVVYKDNSNSGQGVAIVGEVSGTTITNYGAETTFNTSGATDIALAALSSTHFVVAYESGSFSRSGNAIVGEVSGTTITFGTENRFNSGDTDDISVAALSSTHFVVTYQDEDNSNRGTAIVGEVSGTTITSYGAESIFSIFSTKYPSVAALSSTHFVVAYGVDASFDRGEAIIGEVSGTTITNFGFENRFKNSDVDYTFVTALSSTSFVVAYTDINNSFQGAAIIGLVSGTEITEYGNEKVFNPSSTGLPHISHFPGTNSIVIVYRGAAGEAVIGNISGTSICFDTPSQFVNNTLSPVCAAISPTHFVVAFDDRDDSSHGKGIVGDATSEIGGCNDECAGAFTLTAQTTLDGNSTGATQSFTACTGNADDDVWFQFTAAQTGNATISVIPASTNGMNDIVFQMYSGSCGSLTSIACVDVKIPGIEELTTQAVTSGTTYYIRVYDFSGTNADRGAFTIDYLIEPAPTNDVCGNAEVINSNATFSGNTRGATQSFSGCTGDADDDVWYKFTPATSGNATITVTPSGTSPIDDIVFQLYDGNCGSLNSIDCEDKEIFGLAESNTYAVTGSTEYFVRVYDFDYQGLKRGEFTIQITGLSVLPVELVSFRANRHDEGTLLTWATATETNNDGFEVQWSTDSRQWKTIGFVEGASSTLETQSYQFQHPQPSAGFNYYRLKQIDFDGSFAYSDMVSVRLDEIAAGFSVTPNPVQNGIFTLYLSDENLETANLEIFNSLGQLVRIEVLNNNRTTLQVEDLTSGMYWFSVSRKGRKETLKVVVE